MIMTKAVQVSMIVIALIASFVVGRLSYRSHVTEYLEQDLLDKHIRVDKLISCQIELRELEETHHFLRAELGALRGCVQDYSLLFDATKFNQRYSLDEVQRIEECW